MRSGPGSAAPAILHLNPGAARGYVTLTLINAGLYLTAALAIVLLHAHDHPRGLRSIVLRRSAAKLGATAATTLAIVAGIVLPGTGLWPWRGGRAAAPRPPAVAGVPGLAIGVTTPTPTDSSTTPSMPAEPAQVNRFETSVHGRASIVMWNPDWGLRSLRH